MSHTFHIPVLGLAYSVDTPLKIAKYGISSVVSIVDDHLLERMRQYHTLKIGQTFNPIEVNEEDSRAKRVTAYLNMMKNQVDAQFESLRHQSFTDEKSDLYRYFNLLPDTSIWKQKFEEMKATDDELLKKELANQLKNNIKSGEILVNIMSKVDKINYQADGEMLPEIFNDALAALRGFALSDLQSSVVLSAGMNPKLYSYLEQFADFYPDENQVIKKKIILKVSDFRSASIQAKFLAKKGIWVSEFRIESGLNCGGHAFATDGYLLGPILEEFKTKKRELIAELHELYAGALHQKGIILTQIMPMTFSAQGGIGTHEEDDFLRNHYELDSTGWGSPFLLVPEATNVDGETLENLVTACIDDFYISGASPLGVPFNNFRKSTAEKIRIERIAKNRPGSPCTKKYLVSNTEFTEVPICTASREYQHLKIKELQAKALSAEEYQAAFDIITEKICLCEGLTAPAYLKNNILKAKESKTVAICPGPNTAYFSTTYTLEDMLKHIYGKLNLLENVNRSNIFINEFNLYIEHLQKDIQQHLKTLTDKKEKYFAEFKAQLQSGLDYYRNLIPQINNQTESYLNNMSAQLTEIEQRLKMIL